MSRTVKIVSLSLAGVLLFVLGGASGAAIQNAVIQHRFETALAEMGTEVEADADDGEFLEDEPDVPMDDGGDDSMYDDGGGNPMDSPHVYGTGEYLAMNDTGAGFLIDYPGNDFPEDVESYREAVGADPVGYIKVTIDNTDGWEYSGPSDITMVGADGEQYDYESATTVIDEWDPSMRDDGPEGDEYYYALPDGTEVSEDEYQSLNDQKIEIDEAYQDGAQPTAIVEKWFIGPELPDEFTFMEVVEAMYGYQVSPLE